MPARVRVWAGYIRTRRSARSVSDRSEIEIRILQAIDSRAHCDGQVTVDLRIEDVVHIRRSRFSICLLHPPNYSYFAMLREKLHWSELPRIDQQSAKGRA